MGSPKANGGTSGALGNYVLGKIPRNAIETEVVHVGRALQGEEAWKRLLLAVDGADTIILSFPLYWDALPGHLTRALERLASRREAMGKAKRFYAIVNNGFPEPWHNEVAILICKQFAKSAGFEWKGALNIGGGGAIGERPLEETGGMTYRLRETLDIAARTIGRGEYISKDVEDRLSRPLYPIWTAFVFGGMGWRRLAKAQGAKTSLRARPYER